MSAGGGTCCAFTRNILPTKPIGVQFAIAIKPPGLATRRNSRATNSGRGANIAPKVEITTSNDVSGNSSCSASPSRMSTFRFSFAARARACSRRFVAMSTPVTVAPARAAGITVLPVPHATSNKRVPGRSCSRETNSSIAVSA